MASTAHEASERGWYSRELVAWSVLLSASAATMFVEPTLIGSISVIVVSLAAIRSVMIAGGLSSLVPSIFVLCGLGAYAALALRSETVWWGITGAFIDITSVLALAAATLAIVVGEACVRHLGLARVLHTAVIALTLWGALYLVVRISGVSATLALPESGSVFIIGVVAAFLLALKAQSTPVRVFAVLATLIAGLISVLGMFGGHPHALGVAVPERVPTMYQTYQIASSVWAQGPREALVGLGPRRFADAWHAYRPWEKNATDLWNQEPQHGSGLLLTILIEYGFLGLFLFLAPLFLAIARLAPGSTWRIISGFVACWVFLAVSVPTTLSLVIGGFALGAVIAIVPAPRERIVPKILVALGACVPLVIAAWFGLSLISAAALVRDQDLLARDHVDFSRGAVVQVFGVPAPFATTHEIEAALWREYVRARMASGAPVVVNTPEHAYDQLFELHASVRRADAARSGVRLALLDAQIALWSARQGYAANLAEARTRLSRIADTEAPMHVVARLLLAEIQAAQGDERQAAWFRRYAAYFRPEVESMVRGTPDVDAEGE